MHSVRRRAKHSRIREVAGLRPTLFLDIEAVPDAALAQRVSGVKGDGTAALAAVAPPKNEFVLATELKSP